MTEYATTWEEVPGNFLVEDSLFGAAKLSIIDPYQPSAEETKDEESWHDSLSFDIPSGVYKATVGYQERPDIRISRVWLSRPGFDHAWVPEHHLVPVRWVNTMSGMIYIGESNCGIHGAKDHQKASSFEEYYDAVCAATCTNRMAACVDQSFFAFAVKANRIDVSVVNGRDAISAVCIDVHLHQ